MGKRSRAVNCTHVHMDRVFGQDQQCCLCGSSSPMGFLYECRQDVETESLSHLISRNTEKIRPAKSNLRRELEKAGLSESVILTAESGHYTKQQLQKLKDLKRDLQLVITDVQQADQANDAISRLMDMAQKPGSIDGAWSSSPIADTNFSECTFKACHACRPYYIDRLYISFGAVLAAEFPPMTRSDIAKLPVKSAVIMRNIGTRPRSFPSATSSARSSTKRTSPRVPLTPSSHTTDCSVLTYETTQSDFEEISAQRRPRIKFYKMGRQPSSNPTPTIPSTSSLLIPHGLRSAVQGIFRSSPNPSRESSSSGSNISLPSRHTSPSHSRDNLKYNAVRESELDNIRRARLQKGHRRHRKGPSVDSFAQVAIAANAHHVSSSAPHRGSAPPRDSGVSTSSGFPLYSLTINESKEFRISRAGVPEKAKTRADQMRAPDSRARLLKTGTVVQTRPMTRGKDGGLQSIMTQV